MGYRDNALTGLPACTPDYFVAIQYYSAYRFCMTCYALQEVKCSHCSMFFSFKIFLPIRFSLATLKFALQVLKIKYLVINLEKCLTFRD